MSFELVCYLNFGYPTIKDGLRYARMYHACGCRAIQLDVPSKDPYLEQQRIRERMAYCLRTNQDYESYLQGICQVHARFPDMKIYLMLYGDTVRQLGLEHVLDVCAQNDIRNLTIVGASEEEKRRMAEAGLEVSEYVQSHLPDDEVEKARGANVIAYQVRPLPGQAERPGIDSYADGVRYLREHGVTARIYASVGIRTPEDIRDVRAAGADGAFIGGVLMKAADDESQLRRVLTSYLAAAND